MRNPITNPNLVKVRVRDLNLVYKYLQERAMHEAARHLNKTVIMPAVEKKQQFVFLDREIENEVTWLRCLGELRLDERVENLLVRSGCGRGFSPESEARRNLGPNFQESIV